MLGYVRSAWSAEVRTLEAHPSALSFCLEMDIYDVVAAVGIGLVGVGCWLMYPPLGFIAVGSLLLVGAVGGARASGRGGR